MKNVMLPALYAGTGEKKQLIAGYPSYLSVLAEEPAANDLRQLSGVRSRWQSLSGA